MAKEPMKEDMIVALVLAAALASCATLWLLARGGAPPKDNTWFKWMLLGFGAFGILDGIFDRKQKVDMKRINRAEAIKYLLGPVRMRILMSIIGGACLGGAIVLFSA